MRDIDVRTALHATLFAMHMQDLDNTRFVDELDLCGEVRVDVAVINGSLSGYELKSAKDNLRRLPKQTEFYSKILDYSSLVVAENHHAAALDIIPDWWGVTVAVSGDDGIVELESLREPTFNPAIDTRFLARLLWRDELLEELTLLGADKGVRSKPRRVLWDRLCDVASLDQIRPIVRQRLKSRTNWRADGALS